MDDDILTLTVGGAISDSIQICRSATVSELRNVVAALSPNKACDPNDLTLLAGRRVIEVQKDYC